jgi:prepilin-type N-terminal cleavage/methylation domain-containing protein
MRSSFFKKGFTLVELLVALIVTSIVLTAVSTLAFALSSASKSTGEMNRKQAQVRLTELKLQDIFRNCCLVCATSNDDIAVWLSDKNNDNKININELVFIERGSAKDHIQVCTFPSENNSEITISSIRAFSTNWWLAYSSNVEYVKLLTECSNVDFKFDLSPPYSRFVSISFEIPGSGIVKQYQIYASLRSRKSNLLSTSGSIVSDED